MVGVADPPPAVAQDTFDPSVVRNLPLLVACDGNTAFAAPDCVVAPVPPLASASVPASVMVPDEVTGPPDVVNPVAPPDTPTLETVPDPPPTVVHDVFAPSGVSTFPLLLVC